MKLKVINSYIGIFMDIQKKNGAEEKLVCQIWTFPEDTRAKYIWRSKWI